VYIFEDVPSLQKHIEGLKQAGKSIGFVPTMGALHQGHLSLIKACNAECDISVCSIFVNPTQFDDVEDLQKYPRTIQKDKALLINNACDVLFLPSVATMYPNGTKPTQHFDFGYLDKPMEGAHRKGHFAGVAQVVNRLLDIVQAHKIFMGQKDYQQCVIIGKLVELTNKLVEVVRCPIMREPDGLAMSSRNVRLNTVERQKATTISACLRWMLANYQHHTPNELRQLAIEKINRVEGMQVDYLEIVHATTLQQIEQWSDSESAIAITTVRLGPIRLLDNMFLYQ